MMPNSQEAERLEIRVGLCSERGRRPENEDYGAIYLGTAAERVRFGAVAALADGVGGAKGGRIAAELCVRSFIDAYLGEPEIAGVRQATAKALEGFNRWLHAIGRTDEALEGLACTFTALVLRGRQAHAIHVGDTRLYRLREDRMDLLTEDHALSGRSHILTRAIGPEASVQIDYSMEEARIYDRFLLCSDGVHGVLSGRRILEEIGRRDDPQASAQRLVESALEAGSSDNATAIIVDVLNLPKPNLADLEFLAATHPIAPPPKPEVVVDGYRLGEVLADGRYSRVFRAVDLSTQQAVIMKFPKGQTGADAVLRQAFLRESWIATRVRSPFVGESLEPPAGRRSCLYTIMPYYEGETLEQRLLRLPPINLDDGLGIAIKLAKAVAALHRIGVIHRDIKPDNVILLPSGGLKLVDLGVARLPHLEDVPAAAAPGTPSYMAPELFGGGAGDEVTDQFAAGVAIYRMFTGAYPYGEIEPFSHPRFKVPIPLAARRPDLPAWLDHVLSRSIAVRPEERFGDTFELIFELERGANITRPARNRRQPLYHRNPLRFWQIVAAILALALVAALARLEQKPNPHEGTFNPETPPVLGHRFTK
jgi:serine/threonine protein kinase/serine/threonine protein phosphatase PrpC